MPGLFFPQGVPLTFFPLPALGVCTLGRRTGCDLFLPDAGVSRTHASIEVDPPHAWLTDCSRNGTWINDRPIVRHRLQVGDRIRIGRFVFWYIEKVAVENSPAADTQTPILQHVLGRSGAFEMLLTQARSAAGHDFPVLLSGETGTGKELLARYIHQNSNRSQAPMLAVNCAGLSPLLAESELFGHERGSFTGAQMLRKGVLESAGSGSVFLDEIGELSIDMQPILLRALEERTFRRVGSSQEIPFAARIIAATNRDLAQAVRSGTFRQDLYQRLAVLPLHLPALRERAADVEILARHLLQQGGFQLDLTPQALAKLQAYPWPGNIRELRNVLLRSAVFVRRPYLDAQDLEIPALEAAFNPDRGRLEDSPANLQEAQIEIIRTQLERHRWNRVAAAESLGIARSTLFEKMRRYGLLEADPRGRRFSRR